jgi:hypothetical protein
MDATSAAMSDAGPLRRCAACEYDLRGLTQNRCPECGLEFDPNYLPPADVPWVRRADAATRHRCADGGNAFVAYWRTVALVLLRPRKFGETVWQDVEVAPSETTRFRWITIGIATGSTLAAMLPGFGPGSAIALPLLAVPVTLFFWMATARVIFIQFRADRFADEMRFRRLHDLTCAGLALAPLVPSAVVIGFVFGWPAERIALATFISIWLAMGAWWLGSLQYQIHGGRCTRGDMVLHGMMLPIAWMMIAAVILVFSLGLLGLGLAIFR